MRGQAHQWYPPALQRERVRLKQQHHRDIERGETAMRAAFLKALMHWAARRADDDDAETLISVPSGFVSHEELRRVICALLAARRAS